MHVGSQRWMALLIEGAARMGITVTHHQADQMACHAQALIEWNRKINLTAITDPEQMAIKHFLDAIAPVAHIPDGELLDIGTGGGFPGIPLKVMRPHQSMTLIDASRKKINFVKHVLRQLPLTKIQALHARAEDLGRQGLYRERFQVVVCRAFADLNRVARAAIPLLSPRGKVIIYQGPGEEARRRDDASPAEPLGRLHSIVYQLPFSGDRRTLVVMDCPPTLFQQC